MKILCVQTHYLGGDGKYRLSAVDWWRVINPYTWLGKKTGWTVDHLVKISKGKDSEEVDWSHVGEYDVLITSYQDNPKAYSYIKAITEKYGTKYVMDVDDNLFEVDEMNPAYLQYGPGTEGRKNAEIILKDVDNVTTTTTHLKHVYETVRGKPTTILPNYIDPSTYEYKKPEKHEGIILGYQGSSTHYSDVMKTSFIWAIRRILRERKDVKLALCGMYFMDLEKYLPKNQLINVTGNGHHPEWVKIWQKLPFDIGLAPLQQSSFNRGKSNIKYQEYGLRMIPSVYAFWDPYLSTVKHGETGYIASDEEDWYEYINILIESEKERKRIANNAREDVLSNYNIHTKWSLWKTYIEQL